MPLLAKSDKISDGGKKLVITLRAGVKFHDGAVMTAEDVVASLKRWGKYGARGQLLFEAVKSIEASGPLEVTIHFNAPYGPWKSLLAFINGGAAIYPARIANTATEKPITPDQYIGTGPYKFGNWQPNRQIELLRFDGYVSPSGAADGYGGRTQRAT